MNQRRFPRAKYKCTVILQPSGEASSISTATENIGLGGVCVLLQQEVDIFSLVDLEISLDDGKPSLRISGTIVWVVKRGDLRRRGSFDTGIEFSELRPEDRSRLEAVIDKRASR